MLEPFNIGSPKQLSILFFGGKITISEDKPCLNKDGTLCIFKSGKKKNQIKTKKVNKDVYITGFGLNPLPEWETKVSGVYQTNEDVLNILSKHKSEAGQLALNIIRVRTINKMISTYYDRLVNNQYSDKCVRGYFKHCLTDTARLSSDMQQVPKVNVSNVRRMFISRY